MKCPKCGHWNNASLPRCFQCGAPLNARAQRAPSWRDEFSRVQPKKERIIFDDTVDPVEDIIPEDTPEKPAKPKQQKENLAEEMTRLKDRRARGLKYLQDLQENAAEQGIAPSGAGVSVRRSGSMAQEIPDDPDETLRRPRGESRASRRGQQPTQHYPDEDTLDLTKKPEPVDTYPSLAQEDAYALYDMDLPPAYDAQAPIAPLERRKQRKRRIRGPMLLAYIIVGVLVVAVVGFGAIAIGSYVVPGIITQRASLEKLENVHIEASTLNELPAHKVVIPGDEGSLIYIAELNKSFVVVGGVATIEVEDHVFYDHITPLDTSMETINAVLSPTVIRSGNETRMEPIEYTVDIPESELELIRPEVPELTVNASLYTIQIQVAPGSHVYINGEDVSDKRDEKGIISHNPPVQARGNNYIVITVQAPYCREKNLTLNLYRAPTDILLELDPTTYMTSHEEIVRINGTTEMGAVITSESPNDGIEQSGESFTVRAKLTKVGYNTVVIRAAMPGRNDSTVEHTIYYLPYATEYSKKAWALNRRDYNEMMANMEDRIKKAQIYQCQGEIVEILSENPQLAIMDTTKDDKPQLVLLQNESGETWKVGDKWRTYADVSGVYNNMPRLIVRYSFSDLF